MEIGARWAGDHDLPLVSALATQAIDELRPRRGGAIWSMLDARTEPIIDSVRAELASPAHALGIGTIDSVGVGYIAAHRLPLHDGRAMARITDIYVVPDARGVGVGEALMLLVESWALDQDLIGLDSVALPGDRETKNFFETFGLVARAIEVHRPLDP